MLSNIALIRYYFTLPERNLLLHIVIPILGVAALAYPLWAVAQPGQAYPYNLVPYIAIAWLILGLVTYLYFRARAPEKLSAVGSSLAEDNPSEARLMLDTFPNVQRAEADSYHHTEQQHDYDRGSD